jgi:rhodanese-related sulfurtransferase
MKTRLTIILLLSIASLTAASVSFAQYPIVTAEDVKAWQEGKRKAVIIDTRMPEEYRDAHIPGAINIPAERMHAELARLPKDKSAPLIFYCRGVG